MLWFVRHSKENKKVFEVILRDRRTKTGQVYCFGDDTKKCDTRRQKYAPS